LFILAIATTLLFLTTTLRFIWAAALLA
jgi:hypothetical protein